MHFVLRCAEHAFKGFLAERGREAPALLRVTRDADPFYPGDIRFTAEFSQGAPLSWRVDGRNLRRGEAGILLRPVSLFEPDELSAEISSLYSRLFEDELIERDLRVARDAYIAVISTTSDPNTCREAGRLFDQQQRTIRSWHQGADRARWHQAAGGVQLVGLQRPIGGRRAEIAVTDDVVFGADSWSTSTVELAGPMLTATQQREAQRQINARMSMLLQHLDGSPALINAQAMARHYAEVTGMGAFMVSVDVGDENAQKKGLALLKEWLTPEQWTQYEAHRWFEVKGGSSGNRYRINHGRQMNIDELDADGRKVCGWCFLPEGQLVAGDVMLAQKIALETNEVAALKVANRIGDFAHYVYYDSVRAEYWGGARLERRNVVVVADPTS